MSQQKFFDFTKIIGEEMEALLIRLRSLIGAKKITDNLPDDFQGEINKINEKIDAVNKINDLSTLLDGGVYDHVHIWGDWMELDEDNCVRTCKYGEQETKPHNWIYMNIGKKYHSKTCYCGAVITEEHIWDEGIVTVEPTTTSTGVMTYTCTKCGSTKTEEIPKTITTLKNLDVGNKVYLNVDGVPKKFIVVHQGLPSANYNLSCDGTWLLMEDIYEERRWDSSGTNNFIASNIGTYLNSLFLSYFDDEIQRLIKHAIIPDSVYGQIGATIFLLSGYEVGWTTSNFIELGEDGVCLDYFANMSVVDSRRIGYHNGYSQTWWLRSPAHVSSNNFAFCVDNKGAGAIARQTNGFGIRPALILSGTIEVSPINDENGCYNIII